MKNKKTKIIISGGGTGGHIFPAISIANALKAIDPEIDILFVGAKGRMEMQKVPAAGYPIIGLPISGFQRKLSLKNLVVVTKLAYSLIRARQVIRKFKPDAVVGVGGYASGPVLKIASSMGIPTLLQEQNSYAGVTNRLLAEKAYKICVAYEHMERFFPAEKIILTGNPVRQDLEDISGKRAEAIEFFNLDPNRKTLLVLGGSLGAFTINQSIRDHYGKLFVSGVQVIWQTGSRYYTEILEDTKKRTLSQIKVYDFISRMDLAYAAADLVISRAGAGTISELCLVGKPAVLVPSPNVAEDHQTKNAQALVDKDAARLIVDAEASTMLIDKALFFITNDSVLAKLSENISKMAKRDSAKRIAEEVLKLIKE
ncbi:MAG: undecaprenyldiphospho-muramoylpentapeptide beta-N-acetylglucosaminyltransferase [Bacteroidota bacterium]|nr:undecaprenyldiphospho-muramoylpentapeptide beta-N-acetylglucosaminyltransferase [Bacteroidota bacterium]